MSEAKKPTSKELVETARAIDDRTCSLDQMWDEVSLLVHHVLATVREDDDEPVTREDWRTDLFAEAVRLLRQAEETLYDHNVGVALQGSIREFIKANE